MDAVDARTRRFYDELAGRYDEIYVDWERSVLRQGQVLDRLLTELGVDVVDPLLDCACGIGTQLIGLGINQRTAVGTDLSPAAVVRASSETAARGVHARLAVADMRALPFRTAQFAAVICADNSIAHLSTPADLAAALTQIARVLRPGGWLIASTRDYDTARRARPVSTPPVARVTPEGRTITFQLWEWHPDGERYDVEQFFLTTRAGATDEWSLNRHSATYWALTRSQLELALAEAGFTHVGWREPDESGFFQPLVIAANAQRPK